MNQQNKHIVGTNENKTANASSSTPRSILDQNLDVQKLVNQYAGTGRNSNPNKSSKFGEAGYKEIAVADRVIGKYYDINSGTFIPTNKFTIHYSKKGVHIVPSRP